MPKRKKRTPTPVVYYGRRGVIIKMSGNNAILKVDGEKKPFLCDRSLFTILK